MFGQKAQNREKLAAAVLDMLEVRVSKKYLLKEKEEQKLNKDQQEIVDRYSVRFEKIANFANVVEKAIKSGQAAPSELENSLPTGGGKQFLEFIDKLHKDAIAYKAESENIESVDSFKEFMSREGCQATFVAGTQLAYLLKNMGESLKRKSSIVEILNTAPLSANFSSALGENSKEAENIVANSFKTPIRVFEILTKEQLEDISGGLIDPPSASQPFSESLKNLGIDSAAVESSFMELPVAAIRIFYLSADSKKETSKPDTSKDIEKFLENFGDDKEILEELRQALVKIPEFKNVDWLGDDKTVKDSITAKNFVKSLQDALKLNKPKDLKADVYEALLQLKKTTRKNLF